ncbi:MAG: exodeoxyribonuclease V subunit alpha [Actinotalea sp.]|nr:exodeoxyribonuclease V subunit alpha [Actinotalea sp.]
MSAPRTLEPEPADPRRALRAHGLLAVYNRAGVLTAADVHVAQRLARLTGEADDRVVLAAALAVRALRQGAVCVELADRTVLTATEADETAVDLPWFGPAEWAAAIERSRLVAVGPVEDPDDVRPARWVGGRLYLDRYWRDEQLVRAALDERLGSAPGAGEPDGAAPPVDPAAVRAAVSRLFPDPADDRQRLAAATAATSRITVLTGGPGTGKTTTVATLLAALQEVTGGGLRIALAAPTGKAAARLQEAVHAVVRQLPPGDRDRVGELSATTVHRLLGWRSATRFRHDRTHRLPHDVVVVDETSMVSLPLMARLLEALRPQARLVLVGDPDQLASVEAGAVLGDLVARPPAPAVHPELPARLAAVVPEDLPQADEAADRQALRNGVVRLTRVHRYAEQGALADLAAAIRRGDADATLAVLRDGAPAVTLVEPAAEDHLTDAEIAGVRDDVVAAGTALVAAARAGQADAALRALEQHRLLVAHRRGPAGVSTWADRAERWVLEATGEDADGPWPLGLPLLVTVNDRDTGLSNGDTGVVVDDGAGGRTVAFGDPDAPRLVRPHRLPPAQVVHAMTVHRGQGSQFGRVSVVLPPATSPLLTRELLYTAVTRAREHVRVVGTDAAIRVAVGRPIRRASGLREPLPPA